MKEEVTVVNEVTQRNIIPLAPIDVNQIPLHHLIANQTDIERKGDITKVNEEETTKKIPLHRPTADLKDIEKRNVITKVKEEDMRKKIRLLRLKNIGRRKNIAKVEREEK
jgi:hypothetical protein